MEKLLSDRVCNLLSLSYFCLQKVDSETISLMYANELASNLIRKGSFFTPILLRKEDLSPSLALPFWELFSSACTIVSRKSLIRHAYFDSRYFRIFLIPEEKAEAGHLIIRDISDSYQEIESVRSLPLPIHDILLVCDSHYCFTGVHTVSENPKLFTEPKNFIGKTIKEVFGNTFFRSVEPAFLQAISTSTAQSITYHFPNDASQKFNATITYLSKGKSSQFFIAISDSDKEYSDLPSIESLHSQGIVLTDSQGVIAYASPAFLSMIDSNRTSCIGKHIQTFVKDFCVCECVLQTVLYSANGASTWVQVSSAFVNSPQVQGHYLIQIARIHEIASLRNRLKRKGDFEKLLLDVTNTIYATESHQLSEVLDNTMAALGSFCRADRAYIFQYSKDLSSMSNTHEWCLPHISSQKEMLQDIPTSHFPNWINSLYNGETIFIHSVSDLPESWEKEKSLLLAQHVTSLVVVPIIGNNTHYGFMGFDSVSLSFVWQEEEIKLLQYVSTSIGEVYARIEREDELLRTSKEATSFLAKISHEMKSVLHATMGLTSMLKQTPLQENQLSYVSSIASQNDFLINCVRDILEYSHIEQGGITLRNIPFSPQELLTHCITTIKSLSTLTHVPITLDIKTSLPPFLLGDPHRITQIIINLLTNAVKYTKEGSIILSANLLYHTERMSTLLIEVSDTGIGIPQHYLKRIFEPYVTVEGSKPILFESVGLGLPIVKMLCSAMGGSVSVTSTEGVGTTFSCEIQIGLPKRQKTLLPLSDRKGGDKTYQVLVIDDSEIHREILRFQLSELHIGVDCVSSTLEGLQSFKSKPYNLIFIDVHLSGLDGEAFCSEIHKEPKRPPIILMSAHISTEEKESFAQLGIDDYILKPIYPDTLLDVIEKFLFTKGSCKKEIDLETALIQLGDDRKLLFRLVTLYIEEFSDIRSLFAHNEHSLKKISFLLKSILQASKTLHLSRITSITQELIEQTSPLTHSIKEHTLALRERFFVEVERSVLLLRQQRETLSLLKSKV